jgi:hypothetical protein
MTTDKNTAWTRYYESTLSTRQKKREEVRVVQSEKQAPMVLRGAEKQIAEDSAQFRRYRRAKAAEYRAALAGPYGALVEKLHDVLKLATIDAVDSVIGIVEEIVHQDIPADVGYVLLGMIDDAIIRIREQNGLAPFDDAILDDEDPTVFGICKARIGVP